MNSRSITYQLPSLTRLGRRASWEGGAGASHISSRSITYKQQEHHTHISSRSITYRATSRRRASWEGGVHTGRRVKRRGARRGERFVLKFGPRFLL